MGYLQIIEKIVMSHTRVINPEEKKYQSAEIDALAEKWRNEARPHKMRHEIPFKHEMDAINKEWKRSGIWRFDCVLCVIEVRTVPQEPKRLMPDKDYKAFLEAMGELPPLATPTGDVHWPTLAVAFEGKGKHALGAMALGACYELWYLDTPHRMGFCGDDAKRLAKEGLLLIRALPRNLGSAKLPLFSTARS